MRHDEFTIGCEFRMSGRRWRCTDVGTRTVLAIRLSGKHFRIVYDGETHRRERIPDAELAAWLRGPPYAVAESVIDECDFVACELIKRA